MSEQEVFSSGEEAASLGPPRAREEAEDAVGNAKIPDLAAAADAGVDEGEASFKASSGLRPNASKKEFTIAFQREDALFNEQTTCLLKNDLVIETTAAATNTNRFTLML